MVGDTEVTTGVLKLTLYDSLFITYFFKSLGTYGAAGAIRNYFLLGGGGSAHWYILGLALTGTPQTAEIDANRSAVFRSGFERKKRKQCH